MKIKSILFLSVCLLATQLMIAQSTEWQTISKDQAYSTVEARSSSPQWRYQANAANYYSIDIQAITSTLMAAERTGKTFIELPLADGHFERFQLTEANYLPDALRQKYPSIRVYKGSSETNPSTRIWLDRTTKGIHALIKTSANTILIDPVSYDDQSIYMVYDKSDIIYGEGEGIENFKCGLNHDNPLNQPELDLTLPLDEEVKARVATTTMRTYVLALATTYEYSNYFGGTLPDVMSEVTTALTRINSVFERELSVQMQFHPKTDEVFFLTPQDPYTNGSTSDMISENPPTINGTIGQAYDIGHVFGTNAGGLAQRPSVCTPGKARGVTSAGTYPSEVFYVDYCCHEMGHQFGASHTFNHCRNDGNESLSTGYEPGSGSTIMSYSGLCGSNNVINDSYDYYHISAILEMRRHITTSATACADLQATTNNEPTGALSVPQGIVIPQKTPFILTGTGEDADGDELYYTFDQFDAADEPLDYGFAHPTGPLFQFLPPETTPRRFFPGLATVSSGSVNRKEVLPEHDRDLTFRFTIRDSRPDGGYVHDELLEMEATTLAGPFIVTSPSFGDAWVRGTCQPVTWDVANTDKSPVNCQSVNIYLMNIGNDWDNKILLAENTPNDGLAYVDIPADFTSILGKVVVAAADHIFFDIQAGNVAFQDATEPIVSVCVLEDNIDLCLPQSATFDLNTSAVGGATDTIHLMIQSVSAGISATLTASQVEVGDNAKIDVVIDDLNNPPTDYAVEILAKWSATDSVVITLKGDIYGTDFSDLTAVYPADGTLSVPDFIDFSWTEARYESRGYEFQLATDAAFQDIVMSISNLTETTLNMNDAFERGTVYFWRVRGANECGPSDWRGPFVFQTPVVNCVGSKSTDLPQTIKPASPSTVESKINVPNAGEVSLIAINNVRGSHDWFSDLTMTLTSPEGTEITLITDKCIANAGFFNISFSDDSDITDPCPSNSGKTVKPEQPFSTFVGENGAGRWTLKVIDEDNDDGGLVTEWNLEICADIALDGPELVRNNTLNITNGVNAPVNSDLLRVIDADNTDDELTYTLLNNVRYGELVLNGNVLQPGDTWTQTNLNNSNLLYFNFGQSVTADNFKFIVQDPDGGLIPSTAFNIDVTVATTDINELAFQLAPNPTHSLLDLTFPMEALDHGQLQVIHRNGQILKVMDITDINTRLNVGNLPQGVYFLKIISDQGIGVERFVIAR